jgi:hypothetical protein
VRIIFASQALSSIDDGDRGRGSSESSAVELSFCARRLGRARLARACETQSDIRLAERRESKSVEITARIFGSVWSSLVCKDDLGCKIHSKRSDESRPAGRAWGKLWLNPGGSSSIGSDEDSVPTRYFCLLVLATEATIKSSVQG